MNPLMGCLKFKCFIRILHSITGKQRIFDDPFILVFNGIHTQTQTDRSTNHHTGTNLKMLIMEQKRTAANKIKKSLLQESKKHTNNNNKKFTTNTSG